MTIMLIEVPEQNDGAGPVGVIIYVTWPDVVDPAGNERRSLITPDPLAVTPVTVPEVTDAVQVKVEPVTSAVGL